MNQLTASDMARSTGFQPVPAAHARVKKPCYGQRFSALSPESIALIALVALCSALPLLWITFQIAAHPQVLVEAWPSAFRLGLLARTLVYNGAVAIVACALALPV